MLSSGLVQNTNLTWLVFNGKFDFAYLYTVLSNDKLPESREDFLTKIDLAFPHYFDVKLLRDSKRCFKEELELENISVPGQAHLAGSDSYCTLRLYMPTYAAIMQKPNGAAQVRQKANKIV